MTQRPYGSLDHIFIGTPHLNRTVETFARRFGVEPQFGGSHPIHGTSNYLIRAGERCYLELLGPTEADEQLDEVGRQMRDLPGERLIGLSLETLDLNATRRDAELLGLIIGSPDAGRRKAPDGTLLEWETARFDRGLFGDLFAFTIQWGDTPHPSETLPDGVTITDIHVETPCDKAAAYFTRLLRSTVRTTAGASVRFTAALQSPRAHVVYSSDSDPVCLPVGGALAAEG